MNNKAIIKAVKALAKGNGYIAWQRLNGFDYICGERHWVLKLETGSSYIFKELLPPLMVAMEGKMPTDGQSFYAQNGTANENGPDVAKLFERGIDSANDFGSMTKFSMDIEELHRQARLLAFPGARPMLIDQRFADFIDEQDDIRTMINTCTTVNSAITNPVYACSQTLMLLPLRPTAKMLEQMHHDLGMLLAVAAAAGVTA